MAIHADLAGVISIVELLKRLLKKIKSDLERDSKTGCTLTELTDRSHFLKAKTFGNCERQLLLWVRHIIRKSGSKRVSWHK